MYTSTVSGAGRKVLAIILAAALVFGIMPGLGLQAAYAEPKNDVSDYITFPQPTDLTYNGAEQTVAHNATIGGAGFSAGANAGWTYTYGTVSPNGGTPGPNGKPLSAGKYEIAATYEDDNNFGSAIRVFTINPKPITITGVTAYDRIYDGGDMVALTGGTLVGVELVDSGQVGIDHGMATIADAGPGNNKPVTTNIQLTGNPTYTRNYSLIQPTYVTVNIAKPDLTLPGDLALVIDGELKYGETLTASTGGLTSSPVMQDLGALSYQWYRDDTAIPGATGASYTTVAADIGKQLTFWVTAANCEGSVTSMLTHPIEKADGPAAPTVTGSYTGDGTIFTYTIDPIPGAEYALENSSDSWQDRNVFTGFNYAGDFYPFLADDVCNFLVRMKETATHYEGETYTHTVKFTKLEDRPVPALNYTVTGNFPNKTVTITPVAGAEYSFSGDPWTDVNTYTSVAAEDITLAIHLKETGTHKASPLSSVAINTGNQFQAAPPAFKLIYEEFIEDPEGDPMNYSVTIPETAGAEYSFDGISWSTINGIGGIVPGTTVTGYKRMAARDGYNASGAVSDTITLPTQFQVKTPVSSPSGGIFATSQKVTLSTATAGAKIYYTTDGTDPGDSETSILYTAPFTLYNTATVRAIAAKSGMRPSAVMSVTFTKQTPVYTYKLTVSGGTGSGNYAAGTKVTITANPAPSGKVFDKWVLTSGSGTFASAGSATTTFTMTAGAATVTATYKAAPPLVTAIRTPLKTIYLTKGKTITAPVAFDGKDSDGKAWGYGRTAKLTWTSSNKKVATVSATGKIKGIATGTAKITAKSQNGKTLTITVKVVKKAKKLTAVAFKNPPKTLKKGSTKALTLKFSSAAATNLNIKFKSSNANVLKVDKAGKLYAIKEGKAKITVTAGGKKKVVEVIVHK